MRIPLGTPVIRPDGQLDIAGGWHPSPAGQIIHLTFDRDARVAEADLKIATVDARPPGPVDRDGAGPSTQPDVILVGLAQCLQ